MCCPGAVTPAMIKVVYDLNNFIVLAARVPQIYQNFKVSMQSDCCNGECKYTLPPS